ncbi:MAG: hypothetical protein H3C35_10700 [Bacteroidetes bacterium]|nr:hypothetical protein [Bacteroidota bacterium]
MSDDLFLFSEENLRRQIETAPFTKGFYTVKFYTENRQLSRTKTGVLSEFYLYPSGGTLRDENFNLVFYNSQFDIYRGFEPPHLKRK